MTFYLWWFACLILFEEKVIKYLENNTLFFSYKYVLHHKFFKREKIVKAKVMMRNNYEITRKMSKSYTNVHKFYAENIIPFVSTFYQKNYSICISRLLWYFILKKVGGMSPFDLP